MKNPLISIITVCFNAEKEIENTILSVINQTYINIEYIIIDGGSTDGTVSIIKKYEKNISYWVSETDKGIYDAMNKGIRKANGEWLCFMNAGDIFTNNAVITETFKQNFDTNIKVLYGDCISKDNIKSIIVKAKKLSNFYKQMPFCHQASFLRNEGLFYDTQYKIAADYKLYREIYQKYGSKSFLYLNLIIAVFDSSGISSTNVKLLRKEYNLLFKKFSKTYYYFDSLKLIIKRMISK